MNKIKIRKWADLQGLESEDRWGNNTVIHYASMYCIEIHIYNGDIDLYRKRNLYTEDEIIKGGRERVLEELKMCGFDVEFTKKPVLTDEQKLELRYLNELHKRKWLTRNDRSGKPRSWNNKPTKQARYWGFGEDSETKLDYDFISWEDDEPWSIEELLEGCE